MIGENLKIKKIGTKMDMDFIINL